ncbi:LOW QUALITY PROTEIN: hypothetical protein CFOL_v3_15879, partial [Cephalotus follicularis]
YIYTCPGVLNMMRQFTGQRKLLPPAKTKFATAFLILPSIHKHTENSRKMFTSNEWTKGKWEKEALGKKVASIVLMPSFWLIMHCLKVIIPLVCVLRLVDGEMKPSRGYIYGAMDRAKEVIMKSFLGNEEKYKEVFTIIDRRWEVKLYRPLHAAAHFLNLEFYYYNKSVDVDFGVQDGLLKCIQRFVPSTDVQDKTSDELAIYKVKGLFGISMAIRLRSTKAPAEWWSTFGASTQNLQAYLSLTCSPLGCERNWSIFE